MWDQRGAMGSTIAARPAPLVAALLLVVLPRASAADVAPADVQRGLRLLSGIASEYADAFDEAGKLVRPTEIDEARMLYDEARDLVAPMVAKDNQGRTSLLALGALLTGRMPVVTVTSAVDDVRSGLMRATGVRESIVPGSRPSLPRGRQVFQANCAGCHGATGAGDGADAARFEVKPPDFTDRTFMRNETPQDAFNVIALGKKKTGMPAWGDALSLQETWDVVSYVWSLSRTPEELADGRQLFGTHCAGCHGANGDAPAAAPLDSGLPRRSLATLVEHAQFPDAAVFDTIATGMPMVKMPGFAHTLSDDQRWNLTAFVRTLSLEGPSGASPGTMVPDRAAEMREVRRRVDSALAAHRRGDPKASAIATDAYVVFEVLERPLGTVDLAHMRKTETEMVQLISVLRTGKGDAEAVGVPLRRDLDRAADLLAPPAPARRATGVPIGVGVALVAAGLLLLYARRTRRAPGAAATG